MPAAYQLTAAPGVVRRVLDGAFIPADERNRDYRVYLAWVRAGNTADPAPASPTPTTITAGAFLARFTAAEQAAVQQVCLASPQLMLGLTTGLAVGEIDLTGSNLATWMAGLVAAGAITQARATAIVEP
jgi:hypothetical protein